MKEKTFRPKIVFYRKSTITKVRPTEFEPKGSWKIESQYSTYFAATMAEAKLKAEYEWIMWNR